jgi:hypothetical protein
VCQITVFTRNSNAVFQVNVGHFSFAEIPKQFDTILGVTGTLNSLTDFQKAAVTSYGIHTLTRTPSIYGTSLLTFREQHDVLVINEGEAEYFQAITREAETVADNGRPVLVFFKDQKTLERFADSEYGLSLKAKRKFSQITESNTDDLAREVKNATDAGKVSLWTRIFGRGLVEQIIDIIHPYDSGNPFMQLSCMFRILNVQMQKSMRMAECISSRRFSPKSWQKRSKLKGELPDRKAKALISLFCSAKTSKKASN